MKPPTATATVPPFQPPITSPEDEASLYKDEIFMEEPKHDCTEDDTSVSIVDEDTLSDTESGGQP